MKLGVGQTLTGVKHGIYFADGTILRQDEERFLLSNEVFLCVEDAHEKIKDKEAICCWCSLSKTPATRQMSDGILVCESCHESVKNFYCCIICGKPHNEGYASYLRRRFEESHCEDRACRLKYEVRMGWVCCEQAEHIPCVCYRSYKCPVHHPNGLHIGTHD